MHVILEACKMDQQHRYIIDAFEKHSEELAQHRSKEHYHNEVVRCTDVESTFEIPHGQMAVAAQMVPTVEDPGHPMWGGEEHRRAGRRRG